MLVSEKTLKGIHSFYHHYQQRHHQQQQNSITCDNMRKWNGVDFHYVALKGSGSLAMSMQ